MSINQLLLDMQRNKKILPIVKQEISNRKRSKDNPYFEINRQEC